jgi:hypothetical protein
VCPPTLRRKQRRSRRLSSACLLAGRAAPDHPGLDAGRAHSNPRMTKRPSVNGASGDACGRAGAVSAWGV